MKKQLLINTFIVMGSVVFSKDLESLINKANNKIISSEFEFAGTLLKYDIDIDSSFTPARIEDSRIWLREGDLSKANKYAALSVHINERFRPLWDKSSEIRVVM